MPILTLLDVILGIIFVYLIFALITSAINEALAAILSSRAKWLHKGIRALFGEEGKADDNVAAFYSSPFIRYLSDNSSLLTRGVSYIPAPAAMKALLTHTVATQEGALPLRQGVERLLALYPNTALGVANAIAAIPAGPLHDALKSLYEDALGSVEQFLHGLGATIGKLGKEDSIHAAEAVASLLKRLARDLPAGWDALQATVENLPPGSPIRAVMKDLLMGARGNVLAFEAGFDTWFKGFETQVGAWYRQKTHLVLIGISVFIAVAMNVDTIALVRQLSTNDDMRTALATQALARVKENGVAVEQRAALIKARSEHAALVKAAAEKPKDETAAATAAVAAAKVDLAERTQLDAQAAYEEALKTEVQAMEKAGLSFGWESVWFSSLADTWPVSWVAVVITLFTKLAGLILTAAALTLGAPFWFDLLQKVAQVRSVGPSLIEKKNSDHKK
ncbi:hypothetical protein [Pseudoduganella namucuonensis]|uniref:Uncharacterized protein n=1 Tax=Pseudoduganella namucuonensis TaxID=1035707 RepID=A0A1I7LXL4_9BURK|nr:hypothetical protein [Pseudoduganella namucuonensis]SFV14456.1 hypothetical protein SAMN05216552_104228 [Pseudoduganella namucuonensis]